MNEIPKDEKITETTTDFMDVLEQFGEDYFSDMWETEFKTNGEYLIAKYEDAYATEEIYVELRKTYSGSNQDKPTAYLCLDMVSVDHDNELFNGSALAQHDQYPDEVDDMSEETFEDWLKEREDKTDTEMEKWKTQPNYEGTVLNESIEISPEIHLRECFAQITHHHIYKAVNIKATVYTTIELEKLRAFLNCRDLIYSLAWNIYAKGEN